MSDSNKSTLTKADVILMKMDKLNQQMNAVEARVNVKAFNAASYEAVLKKIEEQNQIYKEEMHFLSAQIESVFSSIEKMLKEINAKIDAIKMPDSLTMDVDELSSRVAAKIIIPDMSTDIDEDKLADEISSRIVVPESTLGEIDSAKLAEEISSRIVVPESTLGEIDSEKLAEEIAERITIPQTVVAAAPVTAPASVMPEIDYDTLGFTVAKYLYVPQVIAEQFDYDEVASKIAERLPAPQITSDAQPVTATVADIDYEALGFSVAKNIYVPQAIAEDFDYDEVAERIAAKMPAPQVAAVDYAPLTPVQAEVDYDLIAEKVAAMVNVQEAVSPDYIAAKVAEQIIIPASNELDIEELSRKVADKIALPAIESNATVDEDRLAYAISERLKEQEIVQEQEPVVTSIDEHVLAEEIAERLNFSLSDELIADAVVKNLSAAIDSDEIADCVAKRVGTISPEQFDITVDDDGCDSLAKAVESKLDYDVIAASISEKLYPAFMSRGGAEDFDTEEIARAISEKITVAEINEETIAEKAAAVLSNYLPEVDGDDIADKVVAGVLASLPAPNVDSDEISEKVTEGVVAAITENAVVDTDAIADRVVEGVMSSLPDPIVDEELISAKVDEESLSAKIVEGVMYALPDTPIVDTEIIAYRVVEDVVQAISETQLTANVNEEYEKRFERIEETLEEIRRALENGVIVAGESAIAEEVVEEPENEELVTVSELIGEEQPEEVVEEEPEEIVEEVVEEEPAEEAEPVIEEEDVLEELDESPADSEILIDDDMEEGEGGVDFANMMKYNRSFIARIIQGTDEQKNNYGQVKTALLSYNKVNSNIAWGAERFNKGRETIARFKIRGKTLCLYLALDPNEFETSVYHHADVSDNKSMNGTPMMVKIKSPRGVKKAIRLIDIMLAQRDGVKRRVQERDFAAMYPYETIEELIDDGLVKDVRKNK